MFKFSECVNVLDHCDFTLFLYPLRCGILNQRSNRKSSQLLWVFTQNGTIFVYDYKTGCICAELVHSNGGILTAACKDGIVFVLNDKGYLDLFDTFKDIKNIKSMYLNINCTSMNIIDQFLLVCNQNIFYFKVKDLIDGKIKNVKKLTGHIEPINNIVTLNKSNFATISYMEKYLNIWSIDEFKPKSFTFQSECILANYDARNKFVFVVCRDGKLYIVDIESNKIVSTVSIVIKLSNQEAENTNIINCLIFTNFSHCIIQYYYKGMHCFYKWNFDNFKLDEYLIIDKTDKAINIQNQYEIQITDLKSNVNISRLVDTANYLSIDKLIIEPTLEEKLQEKYTFALNSVIPNTDKNIEKIYKLFVEAVSINDQYVLMDIIKKHLKHRQSIISLLKVSEIKDVICGLTDCFENSPMDVGVKICKWINSVHKEHNSVIISFNHINNQIKIFKQILHSRLMWKSHLADLQNYVNQSVGQIRKPESSFNITRLPYQIFKIDDTQCNQIQMEI
ncbi:hypothetical protein A3Q56_01226 [Intoshia linei]|uniref:Small-subunit processome Utp12 domain-containing protein n=1 Tax=Intoshia linei TaxID=1819745 RepID=A0A177B9M1_9BILA|nr:hypothetical protein A3Q56_01226 [Intoshia linei]